MRVLEQGRPDVHLFRQSNIGGREGARALRTRETGYGIAVAERWSEAFVFHPPFPSYVVLFAESGSLPSDQEFVTCDQSGYRYCAATTTSRLRQGRRRSTQNDRVPLLDLGD